MSQKKTSKKSSTSLMESLGMKFNFHLSERFVFTLGFVLFAVGIYLLLAFSSYFTTGEADQSLVTSLQQGEVENSDHSFQNICGSIGAIISDFLIARCFGIAAYFIPAFIILMSLKLTKAYKNINLVKSFFVFALLMLWCSVAFAKFLPPLFGDTIYNPGGDHGLFSAQFLENILGTPGLIAILAVVALAFLTYMSAETIYTV